MMTHGKKILIATFFVSCMLFVCSCGKMDNYDKTITGNFENYFSNASQGGYIVENDTYLYYANVYDQRRLYRFDKNKHTHELVAEYLLMSSNITANNQNVFFCAWDVSKDKTDIRNIYRLNLKENTIDLLIESALFPLVIKESIYYMNDEAPRDIYEYNIKSNTSRALIEGYDCNGLVYANNALYTTSQEKSAILHFNMKDNLIQESYIEGNPATLMIYGDSIYSYTSYGKSYCYQLNLNTNEVSKAIDYNDGDFYFLGINPTDNYIFFSGSKLVDNRTTGGALYRYDRKLETAEQISKFSGDHFYIIDDIIYIIRENGTSQDGPNAEALSFNGEKISGSNILTDKMSNASKDARPLVSQICE